MGMINWESRVDASISSASGACMHPVGHPVFNSISGTLEDSTLLLASSTTATRGVLYAYDYGDARLKAYDRSGRL